MKKSKERLEVLNRINEFEKEKKFDIDVENDLPAKPLEANEVDYLNKKLTSIRKLPIILLENLLIN